MQAEVAQGSLSSSELTSSSQASSNVSCRHGHWPGNTFLAAGLGSSSKFLGTQASGVVTVQNQVVKTQVF